MRNPRLMGEGEAPWKAIFQAAESKGGVEFYLIEQEGSRFSPIETALRLTSPVLRYVSV